MSGHCGGSHNGRSQAPAAATVQAGRLSGVGPRGVGDATAFNRVRDGSGGLTQGGSASLEPRRFDPGLDYETPFGVAASTGSSRRHRKRFDAAALLASVQRQKAPLQQDSPGSPPEDGCGAPEENAKRQQPKPNGA